jgi:hypothetical protein
MSNGVPVQFIFVLVQGENNGAVRELIRGHKSAGPARTIWRSWVPQKLARDAAKPNPFRRFAATTKRKMD